MRKSDSYVANDHHEALVALLMGWKSATLRISTDPDRRRSWRFGRD